jgi:hypothetical protein
MMSTEPHYLHFEMLEMNRLRRERRALWWRRMRRFFTAMFALCIFLLVILFRTDTIRVLFGR